MKKDRLLSRIGGFSTGMGFVCFFVILGHKQPLIVPIVGVILVLIGIALGFVSHVLRKSN